jgi:hypothetical protein
MTVSGLTSDDTVESLLEPSDGVVGPDLVGGSDAASLGLLSGNSHTWSAHDNEADNEHLRKKGIRKRVDSAWRCCG